LCTDIDTDANIILEVFLKKMQETPVSIDLMVRSFFALGVSQKQLAKIVA